MSNDKIRLVLPTGRLSKAVAELLADAGLQVGSSTKNYRPSSSDPSFEIKLLKAANIPTLIELGKHDIGFTGLDWVLESRARVECVLETGILPVRIVSAAPSGVDPFARSSSKPMIVASEYERLTAEYMKSKQVDFRFVRTYGATEVFPPEDADLIVDNTATGSALRANGLSIVDELLQSNCVFIANEKALNDPQKAATINDLTLLMKSVLDARRRVLLEMNVPGDSLNGVVSLLPAMKAPTVQPLHGNGAFSVKAAVLKDRVAALIPELRRAGASDILETTLKRVIP